jgi:hypothetical protein
MTCRRKASLFYFNTAKATGQSNKKIGNFSIINPKKNSIDPYLVVVVVVVVVTAKSSPSFQTVSAGSTSHRSSR